MKSFVKIIRKPLCVLLAALMLVSCFAVTASAEGDDGIINGKFTMVTFDGTDPGEQDYYYSDDYFRTPGTEENEHLRTMSAALAFTTAGTSETPDETYGAILSNIGFSDITTFDMDHTAADSLGMVLAHKSIDGSEVIAVALRGDRYGVEMATNFIAGPEGDVSAFSEAAYLALDRINGYISDLELSNLKFWVAGYSRAGAVANILGNAINNIRGDYGFTDEDVYVYTFEAPNCAANSEAYDNIHNTIDCRDFIAYIYPSEWGLSRCGNDFLIGSPEDMITIWSVNPVVDGYLAEAGQSSHAVFVSDTAVFLGKNISRETYCEKLQAPANALLTKYYSMDDDQKAAAVQYFENVFNKIKSDENFVSTFINAVLSPTDEKKLNEFNTLITNSMDAVAAESGNPFGTLTYTTLKAYVPSLVKTVMPVLHADLSTKITVEGEESTKAVMLYRIATVAMNLNDVLAPHFNYNVFNQLKALDSYYEKSEPVPETEPVSETVSETVTETVSETAVPTASETEYRDDETTPDTTPSETIATEPETIATEPDTTEPETIATEPTEAPTDAPIPAPKQIENVTVRGITKKTYTGDAVTQSFKVFDGDTELVKDKDFEVSYKNNQKVGTAKVIIKGIGAYSGKLEKSFKIKKAANTLKVKTKSVRFYYSKLKKKAQKNGKAITVISKNGNLKFKLIKTQKTKKFSIIKKTGVIKANKGTKKGDYTLKVTIKAKGNSNYKAKTIKVGIKVKVK